jgi:glycolate oxidase FAD binding subunit
LRTLEPPTVDDVAAALAEASRDGRQVAIRGGGTKLDWGALSPPADALLSTSRLDAVVAHRHGDLTATFEAGAVLDDVNRELARHGQWLPLDPPWSDRATIGGIVSTNVSGPRRHRFGAPRDLIIGVDIVRADGILAKAGGIVVKNVAGYDLARLVTGAFGCLGVVVRATFKLYPLSPASRTVLVDMPDHASAGACVSAVLGSQLTPTSVELQTPPLRLLVRFESIEASVEHQAVEAARLAASSGGRATIVRDDDETREWAAHGTGVWQSPGAVVKIALLPADLAATLDAVDDACRALRFEIAGRAGLGVLLVRLDGEPSAQARAITALRERVPSGRGSVVLLRGSDELKRSIDVWGPMGDAFALMRAVKRSFDPEGILNPGRGPGGL